MNAPKPHNPELLRARFDAIARIIAEVAREAGMTTAMLTGDRRSRDLVRVRHFAFWRAARETGASLAVIARAFGDRDHTTILHGIRMHEKRIADAPSKTPMTSRPTLPFRMHLRAVR